MLVADRVIAAALMALSIYFMMHATSLPIGWVPESGPGGGSFPFWLSALMLLASGGIFIRSFQSGRPLGPSYFDRVMLPSVLKVIAALVITLLLMPVAGAYVALPLFMLWYLRIFGRHSWTLTLILAIGTPVFLFFFFEVTLKILLPKGITEPLFLPLYAIFF